MGLLGVWRLLGSGKDVSRVNIEAFAGERREIDAKILELLWAMSTSVKCVVSHGLIRREQAEGPVTGMSSRGGRVATLPGWNGYKVAMRLSKTLPDRV